MTSGGFDTSTQAISTAAAAFDKESAPITETAQQLSGIKGSGSNTGKAYAAQGQAYHQAITSSLTKLIDEFGTKTSWVSGALSATASDYQSGDTSGAQTIRRGGAGA